MQDTWRARKVTKRNDEIIGKYKNNYRVKPKILVLKVLLQDA